MNIVLIYFSIKYKGYFHEIYNAIKRKEFIPIEELNFIKEKLDNKEIEAITIVDDDYPETLKQINNPPFVLFYHGNKDLLKQNIYCFTGDFINENIENFIKDSIKEFGTKNVIINNLSSELDEKIISEMKKNNFILISANGIENPSFFKNADIDQLCQGNNFLILSEFPNNVNLNKRRLVERNRLTIGLSKSLVIASSFKQSKILSLVSYALEQGKDVYCYPGLQNNEDGNNLLIQDGATMITSIRNKI